MENIIPLKIQLFSIIGSLLFLALIIRLVVRGKLREEYSIIWIACTVILLIFSFWRNGLEIIAQALGVYYAPSLLFLIGFFAVFIFLVHLSVVSSRQQKQIKELAQEMALMKAKQTVKKQ